MCKNVSNCLYLIRRSEFVFYLNRHDEMVFDPNVAFFLFFSNRIEQFNRNKKNPFLKIATMGASIYIYILYIYIAKKKLYLGRSQLQPLSSGTGAIFSIHFKWNRCNELLIIYMRVLGYTKLFVPHQQIVFFLFLFSQIQHWGDTWNIYYSYWDNQNN